METLSVVKNFEHIKAKSDAYGGLSLLDHTSHVVSMTDLISQRFTFKFNKDIALKGALLHDLGKAHPYFQKKISGYKPKSLFEKRKFEGIVHRHELSSLAFLPAFPIYEWDDLIEMVVAHHKSIENDRSLRGIIDLENWTDGNKWVVTHLEDWEQWFLIGKKIIQHFGYSCKDISRTEAENALKYTLNYCQQIGLGWSPWRGLLKAADHFASAFNEKFEQRTDPLFQIPNLDFYFDNHRISDLYPLSKVDVNDKRKHTLVVAPTGAGKTDYLLKRTKGRIFYTLPFQASINAMYDRFKETIEPKESIRLQHGTSKIKIIDNIDEQIEQSLVGASVKVLTPHQLSGIIFGIKNFESIMLDIQGCDVILDEIHTYSDVSQSMVIEIVKALLYLDCRIHIGTATMPKPLYDMLFNIMGGIESVFEVSLNEKQLEKFDRHKIYKHHCDFEEQEIQSIIETAIIENEKILIVFNTVKAAQTAYRSVLENEQFSEVPKMLIHSRFKRGDRVLLETKLKEEFNKSENACMVISTQVVEVSLDISFDRMITEAAPLDSLVQRFGRINRKRTEDTIGKFKPIHILSPKDKTLPYQKVIVAKSFDILPDKGQVFHEISLQGNMDKVYQTIEPKPIDIHLKFKDGEVQLKKLTDNSRSVLIEALEIDGATCIIECDRERYIEANWMERVSLEIPISFKTLRYYYKHYEQLNDIGSNPFVVPQDEDDYIQYGLTLVEPNNFL